MARGRGGKAKRGGGRSFSRDLVVGGDGVAFSNERRGSARKRREEDANNADGDSDISEKSESTEEESEENEELEPAPVEPSTSTPVDPTAARVAKKAQKQQAKAKAAAANGTKDPDLRSGNEEENEEEEEDLINPNHAMPKKFKASDLDSAPPELSRREREAKEKKEAQERYWKLHAAGKTEQAKSDLSRLAVIRKQREEAAAKRKAEQEVKEADIEAKKAASQQKR